MKHIVTLSLAGLLYVAAPGHEAIAQSSVCNTGSCFVNISVVNNGIVAEPDVLMVTEQSVVLHFTVSSGDYQFVGDSDRAIQFKNGGNQFSRSSAGGPKRITVTDRNQGDPGGTHYKYNICLQNTASGQEICVDPVIVNR